MPFIIESADGPVEAQVNKIIKEKQKFERMVITKEEGLELFADNPFKVSIISTKVPDGQRTTVYRCGDLIDLCRGPHVAHTGKVKAFAATRHSATNWLGDTDNDSLQRIYGISFPDKKMLKAWQENQEKVGTAFARKCLSKDVELFIQMAVTIHKRISFSEPIMTKSLSADSSELFAMCTNLVVALLTPCAHRVLISSITAERARPSPNRPKARLGHVS